MHMALRLIYNYLVGRKQRVKIDNEYSTWNIEHIPNRIYF